MISNLLLAIWTIPLGLKWLAFFMLRIGYAYGPLSMTWANEICGDDAEERALVLGIMNSAAYAINAWLPVLTYPAKEAPRFKHGFIFSTALCLVLIGITQAVGYLQRRDNKRRVDILD